MTVLSSAERERLARMQQSGAPSANDIHAKFDRPLDEGGNVLQPGSPPSWPAASTKMRYREPSPGPTDNVPEPEVNQGEGAADNRLYKLPAVYARPVARGWMSLPQAQAGLMASTYQWAREGRLGVLKPEHVYPGLRHIFNEHLRSEEHRRAIASQKVRRTVDPLIALCKPSNVILAEAHNTNADTGFMLTEPEVTDLVATEIWTHWKRARRNG